VLLEMMFRLGDTPFVIVAVTLSCLSFALGAKCGMAHYKRHVAKKQCIAREEYASMMSQLEFDNDELLAKVECLKRENEVMMIWLNRVRNNGIMRANLQFRGSRRVPDESTALVRVASNEI
tara:strand:- start:851 stop:1213 length:363 start_codon:yes stop_codon:yes gene_type:complete